MITYQFGLAGCPPPGAPPPGAPPPPLGDPLPLGGLLPGVLLKAVLIAVAMHCLRVVGVVATIVEELVVSWTVIVGPVCVMVVILIGSTGVFVPIGLWWIRVMSFFASLSCSLVELLLDKDAASLMLEYCLCLPFFFGVKGVLGSGSSCRMKLSRLVGCCSKSNLFTSEHSTPRYGVPVVGSCVN
jgi:hypothetical protein